jgi:hypothetical protein
MNADERAERIDELRRQADEGRENIRRREEARESDPCAMHDYLMAKRDEAAVPQPAARIQREAPAGELKYRVIENAISQPVATSITTLSEADSEGWNSWFNARVSPIVKEIDDGFGAALRRIEYIEDTYNKAVRDLKTEIASLKRGLEERDARAHALSELKREFQGERAEHQALQLAAALAARDHRIDALEERVKILLQYMSLQGLDPPKGL